MDEHVFAYGSLAAHAQARPATLPGLRRTWGVAMDNSVAIPGYKVYEDPQSGARPPVCVAFLDVEDDPRARLRGALVPVGPETLAALDVRERNYTRAAIRTGVWIYRGREEARRRARAALAAGRLVVQRQYLEAVTAALGEVEPPPCPVVDLRRRDLAATGG